MQIPPFFILIMEEKKTKAKKKKYIANPKKFGSIISGFGKPFIFNDELSQAKLKELYNHYGKTFVSYE